MVICCYRHHHHYAYGILKLILELLNYFSDYQSLKKLIMEDLYELIEHFLQAILLSENS